MTSNLYDLIHKLASEIREQYPLEYDKIGAKGFERSFGVHEGLGMLELSLIAFIKKNKND